MARREEGFTVVEVVVSILVFMAGALAVMQTLDLSTRNAFRAEQQQVGINYAQRELEKLRQLDYDEVALSAAPGAPSGANDPRSRVSGGSFALNPDGTDPAELVIEPGDGSVAPGPTPFTAGDVSGQIYRFVVWQDEPGCLELVCPGTHDYKRVIVAVKLDDQPISYDRPYQEVQSDFSDPDASLSSGGGQGTGDVVTAQQFYLSDTRCDTGSGDPARQEITADHPAHDTLGACSSTGRPDALLTNAPPDPAPSDPNVPALFDYADDVEPGGTTSNLDKGLQMLRQDSAGCDPSSSAGATKLHRWVTRPLPLDFVATGTATLELFTRTINNVNIPGALCVYLFKRSLGVLGAELRTPISLVGIAAHADDPFGFTCTTVGTAPAFGKCSTNVWPRVNWGRARFNLSFAPNTSLLLGERLELGISVERGGTPEDAIEFMYDHPDHPSRLEVKTTTPILSD